MREVGHERLIGRTIAGKFVVEELLGAGAMGAVFRARQIALEKTVAIKVLHREHAHDATFAARFHREAKAASRLNHPNSMQVIDFGAEPDGLLYIAMEYLDGRSLHRLLREEWPLSARRTADILMQTLGALAVAHDMGVVHRDLKPENVMVLRGTDDDGQPKDVVKVCDFGIAKITDSRAYRGSGERESIAPVTTAGFLVGTPEYMSPEQGRGDKLGPPSDLYSVGVILFEILTRRVPFEADNAIGVVLKHIAEVPLRPSQLAIGVDPRLEAICLRALRKTPDERYPTAREMRAELRAVLGEHSSAGGPPVGTIVQRPEDAYAIAPVARLGAAAHAEVPTDDAAPKSTLLGTVATIPGMPRRRALVIASAALASGVVIATTVLTMTRARVHPVSASLHAPELEPPPPAFLAPQQIAEAASDVAHPDQPLPGTAAAHPMGHARNTQGTSNTKGAPPMTGVAAPSAKSLLVPSATPSATPVPSTASAWLAPLGPTLALAPTTDPVIAASDPNFDPERGYVEVGLVNAQGAREAAVRAALRGVGLARCYRGALRARGTRATGTGTLNLSFDEVGFARSAIVTGADFLPGLARCLQGVTAGMHIPRSHVDPGGATAEIILAFKMGD